MCLHPYTNMFSKYFILNSASHCYNKLSFFVFCFFVFVWFYFDLIDTMLSARWTKSDGVIEKYFPMEPKLWNKCLFKFYGSSLVYRIKLSHPTSLCCLQKQSFKLINIITQQRKNFKTDMLIVIKKTIIFCEFVSLIKRTLW